MSAQQEKKQNAALAAMQRDMARNAKQTTHRSEVKNPFRAVAKARQDAKQQKTYIPSLTANSRGIVKH